MSLNIDPNTIWRDFVTDGVPGSGPNDPRKVEIRQHLSALRQAVIALLADADPELELPNLLISFAVTGGDENDIEATPNLELPETPGTSLYSIVIMEPNTGPMTINDKPLTLGNGSPVPTGYLAAGPILFLDAGDEYRLLTYGDAEAVQADVEAALAGAIAARDEAVAAAASVNLPVPGSGDAGKALVVKSDLSGFELGNSGIQIVADRAELAALDPMGVAYLGEGVRHGLFRCVLLSTLSADLQTAAATDDAAGQGVFIISSTDVDFVWMREAFQRWDIEARWFGAVSDASGSASANTTAFDQMVALIPSAGKIKLGMGLHYTSSTIAITKAISWEGVDKLRSGLIAADAFVDDTPILSYGGSTGARIQDISMRRMAFWGDDSASANRRAMNLTWVNKSTFEDLYLYNLRRGVSGDNMWSNSFKNISCQQIEGTLSYTFSLGAECNNINFDRVEFRGFDGCKVTGNCAGLSFNQCDIEGIVGTDSTGIHLVPVAGAKVSGVFIASYFENIAGAAIRCGGADANSVRGLTVVGSIFYGGRSDYGLASPHAIILTNVKGFMINSNAMDDWNYGIFIDSSASDGEIKHNSELRLAAGFQQGSTPASVTVDRADT